ncbi:hypothetical protein HPB51_011239 [Rhipicephalus microplus]|uniref:Uncharacterized protein n=1 Tax=Rhipicephalus microplus TaxID=6941 RepID=A0A9J6F205_RHIMP|nr:hypothetical protein HPB51_011239 [Rhipicephalus microplus]
MEKVYGTRQIDVGSITSVIRDEVQQVLHAHRFPPMSVDPETAPVSTDSRRPGTEIVDDAHGHAAVTELAYERQGHRAPDSMATHTGSTVTDVANIHVKPDSPETSTRRLLEPRRSLSSRCLIDSRWIWHRPHVWWTSCTRGRTWTWGPSGGGTCSEACPARRSYRRTGCAHGAFDTLEKLEAAADVLTP